MPSWGSPQSNRITNNLLYVAATLVVLPMSEAELLPFESPVEIVLQEFAWAEAIHRETLNGQVWSRDNG